MAAGKTSSYEQFSIGWLCAIDLELEAARAMLDEVYTGPFPREPGDENSYTFGRIEEHQIVISILPSKTYGTNAAAVVGANMKRSFPHISVFLMVGIGGGAPRYSCDQQEEFDIRLGDVVVSEPTSKSPGVIQYDMGKTMEGVAVSEHVGILDKASPEIRAHVVNFKVKHASTSDLLQATLDEVVGRKPRLSQKFLYPGVENDLLFASKYQHVGPPGCCNSCNKNKLIIRQHRPTTSPRIHYGTIGSGNQVMRDSSVRDSWRDRENIICFEMEAAGLMDTLRCLVIRGIADFGDSHKNDRWQPYASAAAAAYARNLILSMPTYQAPASMLTSSRLNDETLLRLFALVDPEAEKRRILGSKESLRSDLCSWIFEDLSYQSWEHLEGQSGHFWLHSEPGKGKTMITASAVQRLSKRASMESGNEIMAFFFCQQAEARLNNASAILCGLIHYLASRNYHLLLRLKVKLLSRIEKFEPAFSFSELWDILMDLAQHASCQVYLLVDALDECIHELQNFLDYMENFQAPSNIKWFLTSRNDTKLYESLAHSGFHLCLETNPKKIKASVNCFIHYEVEQLAKRKRYDAELTNRVEKHLQLNADGSFLWASLMCRELRQTRASKIEKVLQMYPSGLTLFYERMFEQIKHRSEIEDIKDCERLLCASALAFEPLHVDFVCAMNGRAKVPLPKSEVLELVNICGSFLGVRYNRIYFIHQSAKDFFAKKAQWRTLHSHKEIHLDLGLTSLSVIPQMSRVYGSLVINGLPHTAYTLFNDEHVSADIGYACKYWGYHLHGNQAGAHELVIDHVKQFFRGSFLSWIVILEMLQERMKVLDTLFLMKRFAYAREQDIFNVIQHAMRFINNIDMEITQGGSFLANSQKRHLASHNRTLFGRIDALNTYTSALLFNPQDSAIRKIYSSATPGWVEVVVGTDRGWNQYMRTIKTSDQPIKIVAFSSDSSSIISGRESSEGTTLEAWNLATGQLFNALHTSLDITCLAISPDSKIVAGGSFGGKILIWSVQDNNEFSLRRTGMPELNPHTKIAFSPDGSTLVTGSRSGLVQFWDTNSWQEKSRHTAHRSSIMSIAFNGTSIITTESKEIRHCTWSPESDNIKMQTMSGTQAEARAETLTSKGFAGVRALEGGLRFFDLGKAQSIDMDEKAFRSVETLAFSADDQQIVFVSHEGVKIISQPHADGFQISLIDRRLKHVCAVAISPDGTILACATHGGHIVLLDLTISLDYYQHAEWNSERPVDSLACSPDGSMIAQASFSGTVKLIEASSGHEIAIVHEYWKCYSTLIKFSPDGRILAIGIVSKLFLWDISEKSFRAHVQLPCVRSSPLGLFSPNGKLFAFVTGISIEILDLISGQIISRTECLGDLTCALDFSPGSNVLAFESTQPGYRSLVLWNIEMRTVQHVIPTTSILSLLFSPTGQRIACIASGNMRLEIWDIETQQLLTKMDMLCRSVNFWPNEDTVIVGNGTCEDIYHIHSTSSRKGKSEATVERFEISAVLDFKNVPGSALKRASIRSELLQVGFKDALWLPPSHRPQRYAACGPTVAMVNEQNELTVLRIDFNKILSQLHRNSGFRDPSPTDYEGMDTVQAILQRRKDGMELMKFEQIQQSESGR